MNPLHTTLDINLIIKAWSVVKEEIHENVKYHKSKDKNVYLKISQEMLKLKLKSL